MSVYIIIHVYLNNRTRIAYFHRNRVLLFCSTLIVLSGEILSRLCVVPTTAVNAPQNAGKNAVLFIPFSFFPPLDFLYFVYNTYYTSIMYYYNNTEPKTTYTGRRPFSRFLIIIIICKTTYCVARCQHIIIVKTRSQRYML